MIAAPPVALTAAPARLSLAGAADETLLVTNSGASTAVVVGRTAGFALDLRGRPRIVVRRDPAVRVSLRPARLALRPGATREVTVTSVVGRYARPGDHVALVVLATRQAGAVGIGVRVQLGVVVVVRVPGAVVHRLDVRDVRLRARSLEVRIRNVGNVSEVVGPSSFRVVLRHRGRVVATLRPARREVLPGAAAVLVLARPRAARPPLRAVVSVGGSRRSVRVRVRAR